MRVEQVLSPLRSVFLVRLLSVEAHDGRENLRHEENNETGPKRGSIAFLG